MRILFIKLRHIGDALLLTPTIVATRRAFPDAEIWALVRNSCEGILEGCTELDRVVFTARPETAKRRWGEAASDFALIRDLRREPFDFVFELGDNDRGRWFALACRAKQRCTSTHKSLRSWWKPAFHRISSKKRWPMHQVERDFVAPADILGLPYPPPDLSFSPERTQPWHPVSDFAPESYAVLHFWTRWPSKAWPFERWLELGHGLLDVTERLVISCGPSEEEIQAARELCSALGNRAISTLGTANWRQLAGILARARFFAGVDTAAMHLAAAMKTPTVCLFGPSNDFEFHPWHTKYWMVRPQDFLGEDVISATPREQLMELIPVGRVLDACREAAKGGTPTSPPTAP